VGYLGFPCVSTELQSLVFGYAHTPKVTSANTDYALYPIILCLSTESFNSNKKGGFFHRPIALPFF
jgi:hypothetical protein